VNNVQACVDFAITGKQYKLAFFLWLYTNCASKMTYRQGANCICIKRPFTSNLSSKAYFKILEQFLNKILCWRLTATCGSCKQAPTVNLSGNSEFLEQTNLA